MSELRDGGLQKSLEGKRRRSKAGFLGIGRCGRGQCGGGLYS